MKQNYLLAAVLLAMLTGCGSPEPPADKTAMHGNRQPSSPSPGEFQSEIAVLAERARQLEADFQFDSACELWQQLHAEIVIQFGTDSWQACNSGFALAGSQARSRYSDEQLQQLRSIRQLNDQVQLSFEAEQFSQALSQSLQLYQLQSRLTGPQSIEVGQLAIQIASIESELDQIEPSIRHFHEGIGILKEHDYGDHPELQVAYAGLATAYARKNSLSPAVANQKQAVKIAGRIEGLESAGYATQANQLGVLYHQAGNLRVAHDILKTAQAIRGRVLGPGSTAFGHSCMNLGVVALDQENLEEAAESFASAVEIFDAAFGSANRFSIRCKSHLATIQMLRNRPELAEDLLREVVAGLADAKSMNSENLVSHRYRLAIALAKQGKYDEAGPLLKSVIDQQRQLWGASDARIMKSMQAYVRLLESSHQHDAAAMVRQQIDRVAKSVDGNDFQQRYR